MKEEIDVKVIIVLSGKRKSGKDFVAHTIINNLSEAKCHVMRVAAPIKRHFCQVYSMDYDEMMTASVYKEQRRSEMIRWGEEQRNKDAGVFCRAEKNEAVKSKKLVWILSDARRPSDVEYFREYANLNGVRFFAIRISADIKTRESRGWKFTKDVDDVTSECGLDEYTNWNLVLSNSNGDNVQSEIETFCTKLL